MSVNDKKNPSGLKNWKVKSALLRQINIECAIEGITQNELAELAWKGYQRHKDSLRAQPSEKRADSDAEHDRNEFLHWLLDRVLSRPNPHTFAIEENLILLAFGLKMVGDQPIEDTRGVLRMLYEDEKEQRSQQKPNSGKRKKEHS